MKAKILTWVTESPIHMALAAIVAVVAIGLVVGFFKIAL